MVSRPRDYAFSPARVLVALVHGTPEETFRVALEGIPLPVQEHRKRATLLERLRTYRPSVLILPLTDQGAKPSAPLIDACRGVLPTLEILVVSAGGTRSLHLLAALRQNVAVLVQPTNEQLRSVVLEAASRAHPSLPSGQELFRAVEPPLLRHVMEVAWAATEEKVGLALIASHFGISTRTLEREAARQLLASPREMLAAVRFLRGYAIATLTRRADPGMATDLADAAEYEPSAPLPSLMHAVSHRVRALGGSVRRNI